MSRLRIRDLAVRRAGRAVLSGLSFEVAPGEIFGLLGPNGAGKSTTFQILTGLLRPDAGTLELDDRTIPFGDRTLRSAAGVVFQEPALDKRLTARENLFLAARLHGLSAAIARTRVESGLTEADLLARADDRVVSLSGGMRRRIDLVRALLHEPKILILDEPTAGLDEAAFRRAWTHLAKLRETRGLSIVLTTHRPEEAEQCQRIAILDEGRIVACDTPERLRERVRGDLVILEAVDPQGAATLLRERFGLEPHVLDGRVTIERERAHELVPRIAEAFSDGELRSIAIRRTGLAEVFLELTGHDLEGREREEEREEEREREEGAA